MRFIIKMCMIITAAVFCLCSCNDSSEAGDSAVSFEYSRPNESLRPEMLAKDSAKYEPLNYTEQTGMWFPYMDYADYMLGKSEDEFRKSVNEKFSQAKASKSVNTVYVHVRACGDAYYNSSLFPKGSSLDGGYDPLLIMVEEAHALGLSIHAWINPLRLQTTEQMALISNDFVTKQWADAGTFVSVVNDRYYLNPAYDEAIELVCQGVNEILQSYNVDGIHIDDYFYPTTSPDFDKAAFDASGKSNLSQWRLDNCSRLVQAIYNTVKNYGNDILFGISPQGNIAANYSSQYADVKLWAGSGGYCDYIVPQIYFGFSNETCPFEKTLAEWESLASGSNVSLVIGLAEYKLGSEDKWAGIAGEQEWIENPDIITRQIEIVKSSSAAGYALYC